MLENPVFEEVIPINIRIGSLHNKRDVVHNKDFRCR